MKFRKSITYQKSVLVASVEKMTCPFEISFGEVCIRDDRELMMQRKKRCEFCIPHHRNCSAHLECECHCHWNH